jgi:hypothetical protein
MDINIFLVCYNESAIIPHMVKHYKKYLPSCNITIYDNQSTDNSVEIATALGCKCISFNSNDRYDEGMIIKIKNNCWKEVKTGWIIMADMDEFLCVTEQELLDEMKKGTTILRTDGKNMIGESNMIDLSDIDLQEIKKYIDNHWESKNLCFLRDKINNMNYSPGAHKCQPEGVIVYSSKFYINKHMCCLGLKWLIERQLQRYSRNADMRKMNMNIHYINDENRIIREYNELLQTAKTL